MSIVRLNHARLAEAREAWLPDGWRLWALWPSPVDHDVCFAAAGFTDLADTDDDWSAELAQLIERLLAALGPDTPRLSAGEYPAHRGRARTSLADALLAAASNDAFPACVVVAGEPAHSLLRTSNGHPIIWIARAEGELTAILAAVAGGLELRELELDFSRLL
jgi:hypothetical protein